MSVSRLGRYFFLHRVKLQMHKVPRRNADARALEGQIEVDSSSPVSQQLRKTGFEWARAQEEGTVRAV